MCKTTEHAQPSKRRSQGCRLFLFIKCDVTGDYSYCQEFISTPSHHTTHAKQVPVYKLKSGWEMRRVDSLEKILMLGGLGAGGEGDDRGWDGWMASWTRWTWVWVNSGSWWWTGRPGVLRFMRSQRVGHDWATELNWTGRDHFYLMLLCI